MVEELRVELPVAVLALGRRKRSRSYWDWRAKGVDELIDVAFLGYAYGGAKIYIGNAPRELRTVKDSRIFVAAAISPPSAPRKRLAGFGLHPFETDDDDDNRHHILVEKREGRLDRPCLVVCPTSVVPNWLAEAARLAPELKVLLLHGPDRRSVSPRSPRPIWW